MLFGPVAAMIGLVVGFGSNLFSVIRSDSRMLLHNGHHRAYALRAAGPTHAPAVIQTVTRRDELALMATQAVVDEPAFFGAKRPADGQGLLRSANRQDAVGAADGEAD